MRRLWHGFFLCLSFSLHLGAGEIASTGWTQEAYLWQRKWTPQVIDSLNRSQLILDGIHILAAEITWKNGQAENINPRLDFPVLQSLRIPLTYVIRIAPYYGPFSQTDDKIHHIVSTAENLLQNAKQNQLNIAELQIDFDCAESKLSGYREWLHTLRAHLTKAHPSLRLTFTSLPAWLRHKEAFRQLAQSADGIVLQVHSLEKPRSHDSPITLCDPKRSLQWAHEASEIGRPFRIALPTYGYEVIFGKDGEFLALAAEGPRLDWPSDIRTRIVRSKPMEMAGLSRELAANPPQNCEGLIWFRLPVAGDRHNWSMHTLETILKGLTPRDSLTCDAIWEKDPVGGLAKVFIENTGDTSLPLPPEIIVKWPEPVRPVAWDSLGLFSIRMEQTKQNAFISTSSIPASASIAPGQRMTLAWIRFSKLVSIHIEHHHDP